MRLYRELLPKIAGYTVPLRLERPESSKGECVLNRMEQPIIRIDPDLFPREFLHVFLHEAAHARLKHTQQKAAYALAVREVFERDGLFGQYEIEAERLANEWILTSEPSVFIPGRDIEIRLLTLINHFNH
jgi:hypothetical protein